MQSDQIADWSRGDPTRVWDRQAREHPVVGFVTTARATKNAHAVADEIMQQSNKVVLFFEGEHLRAIARDETRLPRILREQAERAREVKADKKKLVVEEDE